MDELEPDAELCADVESAFDRMRFAEVEITVRLPAECMPNGVACEFTNRGVIPAESVRMQNPQQYLPAELERVMRIIAISLRFR